MRSAVRTPFSVPVPSSTRARSRREREDIRAQARGLGWPYAPQQLLLTVLTSDPERACAAWLEWKSKYDVDTADTGSTRLFPLVVRRLAAAGVNDADFPRMHGYSRHTWATNHHRVRAGLEAVKTIASAGIPVVALKGLSLLLLYFDGDLSLRPMYDVDLLIPEPRIAEADAALRAAGWWNSAKRETAYDYRRGDHAAIDLHWHVLHQFPTAVFDRLAWKNAQPLAYPGPRLLALGPTELLLHVCLHGVRAETRRRRAWPLDVVRILQLAGSSIDWPRLVEFAATHRMTLALEDALEYVKTLSTLVPGDALDALADAPTSQLELEEYRVITSGHGLYGKARSWAGRSIHKHGRSSLLHMQNLRREHAPTKAPDLRRALRPRGW